MDKIPAIIEAEGEKRNIRRSKGTTELCKFVRKKILEEALEVTEALTKEDVAEELGDLLEIMERYGEIYDITLVDIFKAARDKAERAGYFEEGYILELE